MKLTKKQIDIIRAYTPRALKGKQKSLYTILGYYRPSSANWSYVAGYIKYGNRMHLVVTRFGEIM